MRKYTLLLLLLFSFSVWADDRDKFIGTWQYVKSVSSDGIVEQRWGSHPLGYLIYTSEGIMSVQIMRQKETLKHQPVEENFFAYAGHYDIDEKNHVITHHLETAFLWELVGKFYQRYYHFEGDRLYLTVADSKTGQTLIWQKINNHNRVELIS